MQTAGDNVMTYTPENDQKQRGWLVAMMVCLMAWILAVTVALSVGGWVGATIGTAACLGLPAIWLVGEILLRQD